MSQNFHIGDKMMGRTVLSTRKWWPKRKKLGICHINPNRCREQVLTTNKGHKIGQLSVGHAKQQRLIQGECLTETKTQRTKTRITRMQAKQ